MATHLSILAWRMPEVWRAAVHGVTESQTWLSKGMKVQRYLADSGPSPNWGWSSGQSWCHFAESRRRSHLQTKLLWWESRSQWTFVVRRLEASRDLGWRAVLAPRPHHPAFSQVLHVLPLHPQLPLQKAKQMKLGKLRWERRHSRKAGYGDGASESLGVNQLCLALLRHTLGHQAAVVMTFWALRGKCIFLSHHVSSVLHHSHSWLSLRLDFKLYFNEAFSSLSISREIDKHRSQTSTDTVATNVTLRNQVSRLSSSTRARASVPRATSSWSPTEGPGA